LKGLSDLIGRSGFDGLAQQPVSSDSPCGVSVKYEQIFQDLENEIGKLESLSSDPVNWSLVVDLSSEILKDFSKDFLVAAYLSLGLLKTDGVGGLALGLSIIKDLVLTYWDDLFPPVKRVKARVNALEWLSEQAEFQLSSLEVNQSNASMVVFASEALNDLLDSFEGRIDGEGPSMLGLLKILKEAKKQASEFVSEDTVDTSSDSLSDTDGAKANAAEESVSPSLNAQEHQITVLASSNGVPDVDEPKEQSVVSGHALFLLGSSPISGSDPCGIAVKYERNFELLEAELAKQESLTSAVIDWRLVLDLSSTILRDQSKDLLVSAYLTNALLETEGYKGLALSLHIIKDMVSNFWEGLFPPLKRMRAREAALTWLSEKTGIYITNHKPSNEENLAVIECSSLLSDILDILDEKMEGSAPSMLELSRPLKEYKKAAQFELDQKKLTQHPAPSAQKNKPENSSDNQASNQKENDKSKAQSSPVYSSKPAEKPVPSKLSTPNLDASVGSDAEAKKSLRSIQEAIRNVGNYSLSSQLNDSKAFRLNRISTWIMIETPPPTKDGVTQLPPAPLPDKKKQLQSLFDAGNFLELVPQLEQSLQRAPFWLDGQFLIVKALQSLGADYSDALNMVISELKSFLIRVRGLETLKFSDGTPFASDETLLWLNTEVLVESGDANADGADAPWKEIVDEAKKLMVAGKLSEAIALFKSGISQSSGGRTNWQWRFALAKLLDQSAKTDLSIPLLRSLLDDLVSSGLVKWDLELTKSVALMLFNAASKKIEKNKSDETMLVVREEAYRQLCLSDPLTAMTVKG
jgi:type VI secretion system protein VasJ